MNEPKTNALPSLAESLRAEHAFLTVAGVPSRDVELTARERVGTLFRFDVVIDASAASPPPVELIGKSWELILHDGFGLRRSLQGIVAEASRLVHDDGSAELKLMLAPNAYPLSLSRDSR